MNDPGTPITTLRRRRPRRVESQDVAAGQSWRWLLAAPAMIALATSVGLAVIIATRSPSDVLPWYRQQAESAMAVHDYQLACVCYQRLLAEEPDSQADEFGLALSLSGVNRQREAWQLIERLTPDGAPGYPPARLLLAQQVLAAPNKTPELVKRAEQNLLEVVHSDSMNEKAHALLARIYAGRGNWELCRFHIARSGALQNSLSTELLPETTPQ